MKNGIVKAVHVNEFFIGHSGRYHDGEHMKKIYNVWMKTSAGVVNNIDFEPIKKAMGWLRRPCENRLNVLLQGKTIDVAGDISKQIISILKK